ncbi:MAG TPA: hypothetical protein VMG12_16305 [Polyangiaceae bacterium]|nr:hypothetical protein [Polyangiaceae bacterium]
MPQPDSSRNRAQDIRWSESDRTWPVDPAAPHRPGPRRVPSGTRPKEPQKDGRTPDDKDGNEELEREVEEEPAPSSRRTATERQSAVNRARRELESEDTGEWVATERFTLDDELEDTWPCVPTRYLEE